MLGAQQVDVRVELPDAIANAIVSYAAYLGKTFWPAGLTVL